MIIGYFKRKTDEGKGGLFVEGKQISVEDFINDIKNDL